MQYILKRGSHKFNDKRGRIKPGDTFEATQEEFDKFFKTVEGMENRAIPAGASKVVKETGEVVYDFPEGVPTKEWTLENLKAYLGSKDITFHPNTGMEKLFDKAEEAYMSE